MQAGPLLRQMSALQDEMEAVLRQTADKYAELGMPTLDSARTMNMTELFAPLQQHSQAIEEKLRSIRAQEPYLSYSKKGPVNSRIVVSSGGDLLQPSDIARDRAFNYVADTGNNRVVWFHHQAFLNTEALPPSLLVFVLLYSGGPFGTTPTLTRQHQFAGDTTALALSGPLGLGVDPKEATGVASYIYVADTGNDRVVKIALPTR